MHGTHHEKYRIEKFKALSRTMESGGVYPSPQQSKIVCISVYITKEINDTARCSEFSWLSLRLKQAAGLLTTKCSLLSKARSKRRSDLNDDSSVWKGGSCNAILSELISWPASEPGLCSVWYLFPAIISYLFQNFRHDTFLSFSNSTLECSSIMNR